ncbi:integrase core domain-containing protein [Phytopseudomonas daroniae]|uniref:integrase core domain-containing protein n=1 Tax=Phytopseudomonas daroniae TaxID=2487519 RepID=UPI003BF969B0
MLEPEPGSALRRYNEYGFCSLVESRIRIAAWHRNYNEHRPHSDVGSNRWL